MKWVNKWCTCSFQNHFKLILKWNQKTSKWLSRESLTCTFNFLWVIYCIETIHLRLDESFFFFNFLTSCISVVLMMLTNTMLTNQCNNLPRTYHLNILIHMMRSKQVESHVSISISIWWFDDDVVICTSSQMSAIPTMYLAIVCIPNRYVLTRVLVFCINIYWIQKCEKKLNYIL